jgi:hypothetical protein
MKAEIDLVAASTGNSDISIEAWGGTNTDSGPPSNGITVDCQVAINP